MTSPHLTAAATALLLGAAPVASAHAQNAGPKDTVQTDAAIVRQAVRDNLLEVRLGEVAQHQASNKMVRGFAQRMVTDHQRLKTQWTDLATKYGVNVADSLGAKGQDRVRHFQGVAQASFDKEYMTTMIRSHARDAARLRTALDSAQSDPVRKLIGYERPIILDHLQAAAAAGKEVGVDTTVVNESKKIAAGKPAK